MILEKLGTRPELFSSMGLSVTEYLKQAPPHDMRLFIWTLEEHRDDYVSCHIILDEYFDMMGMYFRRHVTPDLKTVLLISLCFLSFSDGHCSVLKKSDENENVSPNRQF